MSSSIKGGDGGETGEMKKFLFDTHDFDTEKAEQEEAPVFSEEQIALAKSQSYTQGRQDGLREALGNQEEKIAAALQQAVARLDALTAAEDRREAEKLVDATKLAMRVAHKLLPQFARTHALAEIEGVILQSLEARREEARIAVSVPTAHLGALKDKIDTLALEKGFAGKVILLADDALAPTDCRVEWADGGAERLYERLYAQIETEFAKAIAGIQASMEMDGK